MLVAGLVLTLTRSACADERSPTDGHKYSLGECLALTERNHPALAAVRARLGAAFGLQWSLDLLTKSARVRQAQSNLDEEPLRLSCSRAPTSCRR